MYMYTYIIDKMLTKYTKIPYFADIHIIGLTEDMTLFMLFDQLCLFTCSPYTKTEDIILWHVNSITIILYQIVVG